VYVEQVILTPHDAEKLLMASIGTKQRALRSDRVARLIRSIQSGQWQVTHQAIAISPDGVVVDGQHRLTAIAGAGVDVKVMLARDVDPATFGVLDTGATRSPADVLRISGFVNTNQLAAAARYLLAYEEVVGSTDSMNGAGRIFTTQDIVNLCESEVRGPMLVNALPVAMGIATSLLHPGFATFLAPIVVLMKESPVDDGLCLEFLERLRDGTNLSPGSPILALRRFLMQDTGLPSSKHSERATVGMATIIKAFNGWLEGGTRSLMSFRPGIERLPAIVPTAVTPAYLPS